METQTKTQETKQEEPNFLEVTNSVIAWKRKNREEKTKQEKPYWDEKSWAIGSRVCVTDGDWTIGWGIITGFSDDAKLWAIVQLDDADADTKGYSIINKKGFASGYKGYCYKPSKED